MVHGDQTNRMLARITLGILCYGHWERGHLQHHAKVGTWEDPSTARMGETFYAFAIRNVRGNLAEAWNFEARRLRTAGLPPWHPTNMFFRWAAASAAPATSNTTPRLGRGKTPPQRGWERLSMPSPSATSGAIWRRLGISKPVGFARRACHRGTP